ncbi:MAG: hypothetical protein AAGF12_03575 [Myxococcota bacterium]
MRWTSHGLVVDSVEWPVVRVWVPHDASLEAFQALLDYYEELCGPVGEPTVIWITDFSEFDPFFGSPTVRRAAADLFRQHRPTLEKSTLCEARIAKNPVTRGIMLAFDWLTGAKWPTGNFATEDEARTWIMSQTGRWVGPPPSRPPE